MTLQVVVERLPGPGGGVEAVDVLECGHEIPDLDGRGAYRRDCRLCSEEVETLPLWW